MSTLRGRWDACRASSKSRQQGSRLGRLSRRQQILFGAGWFIACLVAMTLPVLFGRPFGWFGRLWALLATVIYWTPLIGKSDTDIGNSQTGVEPKPQLRVATLIERERLIDSERVKDDPPTPASPS